MIRRRTHLGLGVSRCQTLIRHTSNRCWKTYTRVSKMSFIYFDTHSVCIRHLYNTHDDSNSSEKNSFVRQTPPYRVHFFNKSKAYLKGLKYFGNNNNNKMRNRGKEKAPEEGGDGITQSPGENNVTAEPTE